MISIFIEPQSAYIGRFMTPNHGVEPPIRNNQIVRPEPADRSKESYWAEILIETLQLEGNVPMPITSLVNSAAKWGDYGCRADREQRKLDLFKLIGRLIRQGRLRRIARNFVLLATVEEQKRHEESVARQAPPLELPAPNV
jgi:hypothetical protein